jgi:predicted lipid carrier protein YhbT
MALTAREHSQMYPTLPTRLPVATWGLTIQGKTVTLLQGVPRECAVGLSTDAESMILLTVGRADVAEKLQSAALTITGDIERGKQLCATLFRAY